MIARLRQRRDELFDLLRTTAIQVEQLRGALALCDQLIAEAEGNGLDLHPESNHATKPLAPPPPGESGPPSSSPGGAA